MIVFNLDEDYATKRRRERAAAAAGLTTADEPDWKSTLRSRSVQVCKNDFLHFFCCLSQVLDCCCLWRRDLN